MSRVEYIADQMAVKIAAELQLDEDKRAVMAYGLFAFMHMSLCALSVIVVGALFGVPLEAFLISLTASFLRKSSGGAHASKPWICNAEGVIISVVPAILLGIWHYQLTIYLVFITGVIAFIWAYYITLKLAPVDSPGKPIKKQATRERLKKRSLLILNVYVVIALVSLLVYYLTANRLFLKYSFCIVIGVIWQVFTLTKTGHLLLNSADVFLNNLFKKRGRES
ncbi:MAG: accessory regulator AgrB [Clostridia bacterium]|jgi:accessory gene regulator B|nr:accessory regulator AgrB [Clostridia bacterium]